MIDTEVVSIICNISSLMHGKRQKRQKDIKTMNEETEGFLISNTSILTHITPTDRSRGKEMSFFRSPLIGVDKNLIA